MNIPPPAPPLFPQEKLPSRSLIKADDTHRANCILLNSTQELIEIETCLLLFFFLCLHSQLISIHSIIIYSRVEMFEKCDSSKRQKWMVASFSISTGFTAKFDLLLVLTQENAFSKRCHFKFNRKSIGSSKKSIRNFWNSPPFEGSACFYVTVTGNFERFLYFNFETCFLKNANLFQKTGLPFFS